VRPFGNVIEFKLSARSFATYLLPAGVVCRHVSSKYRKLFRYISPRIRIVIFGRFKGSAGATIRPSRAARRGSVV